MRYLLKTWQLTQTCATVAVLGCLSSISESLKRESSVPNFVSVWVGGPIFQMHNIDEVLLAAHIGAFNVSHPLES